MPNIDPYERIIWSADVPDVPTLLEQLDTIPELRYIKIDRLFVDANGWDVFAVLNERGLKVFDDAKLVEIPSKLELLATAHCEKASPWMLNCMAGSLSNANYDLKRKEFDGLRRFAKECADNGVLSCAVSVLTTKSEEVVANEFAGRSVIDQVYFYAEQLVEAGFTHMVCAPPEVEALRKNHLFDGLQFTTPGVRPKWAKKNDQDRVMTPAEAIAAGSDQLVIGRPITNGPGTPAENLAAIAIEVETALKERQFNGK